MRDLDNISYILYVHEICQWRHIRTIKARLITDARPLRLNS